MTFILTIAPAAIATIAVNATQNTIAYISFYHFFSYVTIGKKRDKLKIFLLYHFNGKVVVLIPLSRFQ